MRATCFACLVFLAVIVPVTRGKVQAVPLSDHLETFGDLLWKLSGLVTGLSSWVFRLYASLAHVGFVADEVALG
jgi:hypothetical protein